MSGYAGFTLGRSTFKCESCGHNTRMTADNEGTDLCGICYEFARLQNAVSDNSWEIKACIAERGRQVSKMKRRGGDLGAVQKRYPALFSAVA